MVFARGLFHLGCGIFYIYGTYHDMQIVSDHLSSYGGRSKYLTFLNLVSFLAIIWHKLMAESYRLLKVKLCNSLCSLCVIEKSKIVVSRALFHVGGELFCI